MGSLLSFSAMFSKGNNFRDFLFAYPENEVFPRWESDGANFVLYEMITIYMGGNNENDRVAFPESVPIHLYWELCIYQM